MNNRREALSRARQYRTCPPQRVAQERHHEEKLKRHLAVCPYCAGHRRNTLDPWENMAIRITQPERRHLKAEKTVTAGGLYYVKQERAGWQGDYYYNPPLVLVLSISPAMADAVQVAQTYHETCLAGPGDLILSNDQTGYGELFVECWHTYTLRAEDLGKPVGNVSNEVRKAVLDIGENMGNIPDWAVLTRPLTDQDPRIYFRELEVECGFVFGARAVAALMAQLERPLAGLVYRDANDLRNELTQKIPGLNWPVAPDTPAQVLALARCPDEMLPLAADTADIRRFRVNLIHIHQGRVERFSPLVAEIFMQQVRESRVTISGRIPGLPEDARACDLLIFWPDQAQRLLQPLTLKWDPAGANFFMTFAPARHLTDFPAMALVCESGGG